VDVFPLLSRFNAWANEQIYTTCAGLSDEDYHSDRKVFFGSIHNTLNHNLVVDLLWVGRARGIEHGIDSLDQILHDDFDSLRRARVVEDQALVDFAAGLGEEGLNQSVDFHTMAGVRGTMVMSDILMTVFNHQTHHRGQVTAMLTQMGVKYPGLDIPNFLGAV
jgi:uncharacterized damage-inducible protein DinB